MKFADIKEMILRHSDMMECLTNLGYVEYHTIWDREKALTTNMKRDGEDEWYQVISDYAKTFMWANNRVLKIYFKQH